MNHLKMEEKKERKKRRDTDLFFGKENKKLLSIRTRRNIQVRGREEGKKEEEKNPGLSFGKENKKVLSQNPRSYSILRVLWNHFGRST